MSTRLDAGGSRIDRAKPLTFSFNGKRLKGYEGDTLASALLANGQTLVGRSFKYHRPRGIVASGPEEPNALFNIGEGGTFEPNARATTTPLRGGLTVRSQNHWPSLEFDVGAINARLSRFLPAGFYYKMFIHPRSFWKHVYEPFIRQSAGLGQAPVDRDANRYEHAYAHTDVLVIGGGLSGLHAAHLAASAGADVMLLERETALGGRSVVDLASLDGGSPAAWVSQTAQSLASLANVTVKTATVASGLYDHGYVLADEALTSPQGLRSRLWRIRAKTVIVATGAIERPLSFAGNDRPGVMLASAVRDYLAGYGVSVGDRTVLVTNNDDGYRTALALVDAGLSVPAIIDARPEGGGSLADAAREKGIRIETGCGIAKVKGSKHVEGVAICRQAGEGAIVDDIACDCVAMSGGWSPAVHLWSHCGEKLVWNEQSVAFEPDPASSPTGADGTPNVFAAGLTVGSAEDCVSSASEAARAACGAIGLEIPRLVAPAVPVETAAPILAVWTMPQGAGPDLREKMWLDFQNDVKVSDVQLAAQEGFESVEHTKRYTTLGMATDQGKLSNINGLAILSKELDKPIPQVGTTTFRPPYQPLTMGSIGGEARGPLFQPVRQTPMHDWHDANGVVWEPVGHWRRPYAYPGKGETVEEAVAREVTTVRSGVGLLDASTLGKLIVKGPDAGTFLDLIYTNMMSTLKVGRCRYGLMCSENGFLMDDGVVARLSEDTFLCHTTSGGADRIHAHLEEWLQTEWWDLKVWVVNATEQYAQIAVVGPKAREILETLGGLDVSREALPFMGWMDGSLAGLPVRVFRISFSGELSYEIAVPAGLGRALWDRLLEAGEGHDIAPYGTEALHIMRAEKGFIMIGDETDGTVTPQDLGLHWAISKKKEDFIGKRGQMRSHMTAEDRWRLVGLETVDGQVLPDGAYAIGEGETENGQRRMIGRVTSTYMSPTLERGIAMGLVEHGPERMGEILDFPTTDGEIIQAKIVDPVFYDPEGERQDV
ncbi:sarcosine oxidase subunit alpha family protein [Aestuariibius insulae]|uniref:sarcosine oxidase subunit alpha family protein n=1 Tax=Aestuariibius insulae TaxID=2058287 RepID=UPI00345E280C